jgi:uncharacterized protein (TIGR02611 family)
VTRDITPDARNAHDHTDNADGVDRDGDPDDRDWAWRRRIRSKRNVHLAYRVIVGLIGGAITVLGLVLIPAPGPGWLVVFLGLAVLASEFEWASRLLGYARHQVGRWTDWATSRSLAVRILLGLGTLAILAGLMWVTLRLTGIPGFVPNRWLPDWSGLQG